jgi:hypothetical protein
MFPGQQDENKQGAGGDGSQLPPPPPARRQVKYRVSTTSHPVGRSNWSETLGA